MSHWGGNRSGGWGVIPNATPETELLLRAVPIGISAGLLGGRLLPLLLAPRDACGRGAEPPLALGPGAGVLISAMLLSSQGLSGGDGERLMTR